MQKEIKLLKKRVALCLALPFLFLLTGCPHNDYVVELTPHGNLIERKLTFYRDDGTDTNGVINYQVFSSNELAGISALYPQANATNDGYRHVVMGEFKSAMPQDVGGAGWYTNHSTTLGSAGFYTERFRGNDDLAERTAKRMRAADQLVDLLIGWSRMELGNERNYQHLRRFLDKDFRNDIKNFSLYFWLMQASATDKRETPVEFGVRFGQYLVERGYLGVTDLPDIFAAAQGDEQRIVSLIQRLVATKLELKKSAPLPPALAFLSTSTNAESSFEDYLRTTDRYRAKLRQWQKEKVLRELEVIERKALSYYKKPSGINTASVSAMRDKPDPSQVVQDIVQDLIEFDLNDDDHVNVRLALAAAPDHTNGKWDEKLKQVVWNTFLEHPSGEGRLPVLCYANWTEPNEAEQIAHFGKVILKGENLSGYCLWRSALNLREGLEWDTWLKSLSPAMKLKETVEAFRFSSETNSAAKANSGYGRDLIVPNL